MSRRHVKPARQPLVLRFSKSPQQIPVVWGLRSDVYSHGISGIGLTLINDDPTLMNMDAPEVLPTGSCYSQRLDAETDGTRIGVTLREDWRHLDPNPTARIDPARGGLSWS